MITDRSLEPQHAAVPCTSFVEDIVIPKSLRISDRPREIFNSTFMIANAMIADPRIVLSVLTQ